MHRRVLLLQWDLKRDVITAAYPVGKRQRGMLTSVFPLHVAAAQGAVYYIHALWERGKSAVGPVQVTVMKLTDGAPKKQFSFAARRRLYVRSAVDAKRLRVFVAEYSEIRHGEPRFGYLLDLTKGTHRQLPAPSTPYGLAFGPGGRYLYGYSSEVGTLTRLNLATGKIDKRVKAGKQGHAMGFLGKRLVLVRNAAVLQFSVPALARKGSKAVRRKKGVKCNTAGSRVGPHILWLRCWDRLRLVRP
jgi:hypothetical protein